MLDLIIKNGTIITADETYKGEIGVENGVITYIGSAGKLDHLINTDPENGPVTKVIDAEGKYVMPGLIEPHMHVKAPFSGTIDMLDFYTASKCAAFGGVRGSGRLSGEKQRWPSYFSVRSSGI